LKRKKQRHNTRLNLDVVQHVSFSSLRWEHRSIHDVHDFGKKQVFISLTNATEKERERSIKVEKIREEKTVPKTHSNLSRPSIATNRFFKHFAVFQMTKTRTLAIS
jgi:hypothetical protein